MRGSIPGASEANETKAHFPWWCSACLAEARGNAMRNGTLRGLCAIAVAGGFYLPQTAQAQDGDRERERDRDRVARIEPGTVITVRTNEPIDSRRSDGRVYTGVVERDVRGDNDRLAI